MTMRYRVGEIERFGLVPHAVYGGFIHSFKCPAAGDTVYDAALLDSIFAAAQNKADGVIEQRNEATKSR
jgi:hypothetical protein